MKLPIVFSMLKYTYSAAVSGGTHLGLESCY